LHPNLHQKSPNTHAFFTKNEKYGMLRPLSSLSTNAQGVHLATGKFGVGNCNRPPRTFWKIPRARERKGCSKRDPVTLLKEKAEKNLIRVNGMIDRLNFEDRGTLEDIRNSLLGTISTLTTKPWTAKPGTRTTIDRALTKAIGRYREICESGNYRNGKWKKSWPKEPESSDFSHGAGRTTQKTADKFSSADKTPPLPQTTAGPNHASNALQESIDAAMNYRTS
jgi:hypothetical protein